MSFIIDYYFYYYYYWNERVLLTIENSRPELRSTNVVRSKIISGQITDTFMCLKVCMGVGMGPPLNFVGFSQFYKEIFLTIWDFGNCAPSLPIYPFLINVINLTQGKKSIPYKISNYRAFFIQSIIYEMCFSRSECVSYLVDKIACVAK